MTDLNDTHSTQTSTCYPSLANFAAICKKITFYSVQEKLKKRNVPTLIEDFCRKFYLSRGAIRAAVLFWKGNCDVALRKRNLAKLERIAKEAGHGDIASLFS